MLKFSFHHYYFIFHILTNTKFKQVTTIVDIWCLSLHLMLRTFIELLIFSVCVRVECIKH